MKNRHLIALASISSMCFFSMTLSFESHAEIYKWTDDKGVTHYTERPPKERESTTLKTSHNPPSTPYSPTTEKKPEEVASAAEPEKTEEQKAQEKEYCERAKSNLKVLNEHARVRTKNKKGEMEILSTEAKQKELDQANTSISDYCK